jgi:hypothetical protein
MRQYFKYLSVIFTLLFSVVNVFSQNPCNSIISVTCGVASPYSLVGNGNWSPPTGFWWTTPGNEQVFSYTPNASGPATINITNNNYYVDLFQSNSCGSSGWTYIDDIYSSSSNTVNLTAGVTYYFLIDDENTTLSSGTITISCPPPPQPPCATSIPAANTCDNATSICDFNGYCGNTSSSYTVNSWGSLTNAFCGSIENNSFFSFVANATTVSLDVWVSNCTNNDGVQFMIFSSTGNCSGTVTSYICENQMSPGYTSVITSGLTIGNTYYLMVDGFAGDICDYVIGADSTSGILLPVTLNTNAVTICSGESTTLTASGGDGTYTWSPSIGLNSTNGTSVIASPNITTTYTVSSFSGNLACPTASTEQVTVNVTSLTPSFYPDGPYCFGEIVPVLPTTSINGVTGVWSPAINNTATTVYTFTPDLGQCATTATLTISILPALNLVVNSTDETCDGEDDGTASISIITPPGNISLLTYCASSPNTNPIWTSSSSSSIIEQVILNGDNNNINNLTAGFPDFYEDYTIVQYADITEGQNYTVSVTLNGIGTPGTSQNYSGAKIYIDFNIDGDFNDPGEEVGVVPYTNAVTLGNSVSIPFIVPITGVYGPTRMRVVSQIISGTNPNSSSIGPCDFAGNAITGTPIHGATEDYSIVLNTSISSYTWSNGSTNDSVTGLPPGTYSVAVTDANGCPSNTSSFTIDAAIPITVTLTALPNPACIGDSIKLSSIATPSLSSNLFQFWHRAIIPGGSPPWTSISPYSSSDTASYIIGSYDTRFRVRVKDSICISPWSNIDIVIVNTPPTAYAGLDTNICAGDDYIINGSSTSNSTSLNWTSNGTGTFSAVNTLNPTYSPSPSDIAVGSVVLTLTAMGNSACDDAISTILLTIYPLPISGPIWHN